LDTVIIVGKFLMMKSAIEIMPAAKTVFVNFM